MKHRAYRSILWLLLLGIISCKTTSIPEHNIKEDVVYNIFYDDQNVLQIEILNQSTTVQDVPFPFTTNLRLQFYDNEMTLIAEKFSLVDTDNYLLEPNQKHIESNCLDDYLSIKEWEGKVFDPKFICLYDVPRKLKSNIIKFKRKKCKGQSKFSF